MIRNFAFFVCLFVPSLAFAQLNSEFIFNGQNAEVLKAEKQITIVTPEVVQVPDTCTRKVPAGESEVCRNETRHRQECSWNPSRERCWDEMERVCRPVARSGQRCSDGPSRRVCSREPTRRVCTREPTRQVCSRQPTRRVCSRQPARRVCSRQPARQVCTERPTRNVCTTRPDGREHCTTVGGGQSCHEVGGEESCHDVGGEESCHDVGGEESCHNVGGEETCNNVGGGETCQNVPGERVCEPTISMEQECSNVSRRQCETIPGSNVCHSIPYDERVCRMEMQYRTESYACTRSERIERRTVKLLKNEINIKIVTNGLVEEFPVMISVKEVNQEFENFTIDVKLLKEPGVFVVLKKKSTQISSENKEEILLKSDVILEVLSKEMLPTIFPSAIAHASISAATKKLVIVLEGQIHGQGAVEVLITHKAFLGRTKKIAQMTSEYPGKKVELGQVEGKAALSIDLEGSMKRDLEKKNMKLKLKLSSELNLQGELLNAQKPETSKLYEDISVKLK